MQMPWYHTEPQLLRDLSNWTRKVLLHLTLPPKYTSLGHSEALQAMASPYMKITARGELSAYCHSVYVPSATLDAQDWARLLEATPKIQAFLAANADRLEAQRQTFFRDRERSQREMLAQVYEEHQAKIWAAGFMIVLLFLNYRWPQGIF
jgi:hypothetical protein